MAGQRPTDEQIVQHLESVRNQSKSQSALVLPPLPLTEELSAELAGGSMEGKEADLHERGYTFIRRCLNDGSCFYRALLFALLEQLANATSGSRTSGCNALLSLLEQQKRTLQQSGYEAIVFEDGMSLLERHIAAVRDRSTGTQELQAQFDGSTEEKLTEVAHMIMVLRLITSAEIRANAGMYEPFLMLGETSAATDVAQFCSKHVEPMSEEADSVAIVALVNALRVRITVVYLSPGSPVSESQFEASGGMNSSFEGLQLTLLYRPGHYDILLKRA